MDGSRAIEHNRQALKRILAALVAMTGLWGQSAFLQRKGVGAPEVAQAGEDAQSPASTLPRHVHLAVLRLLRPAEAAARRLIIAAACGLVAALPRQRPSRPQPPPMHAGLRGLGIAVVISPTDLVRDAVARRAAALRAARPRGLCLPLFDPLARPFRAHRRHVPAHAAPRILLPGVIEPFALPAPPAPDDLVSATRLGQRFAALAAALDDLPGQAERFARWKARRAGAARAQRREPQDRSRPHVRFRRVWPLRMGRLPGRRSRSTHEVFDVLANTHALALWALEAPDTS